MWAFLCHSRAPMCRVGWAPRCNKPPLMCLQWDPSDPFWGLLEEGVPLVSDSGSRFCSIALPLLHMHTHELEHIGSLYLL